MELQTIQKSTRALKKSGGQVVSCRIKASFSKVVNLESGEDIYAVQTEDKVFTPLSVTVGRESFEQLSVKETGSRVELDLSHGTVVDCCLQKAEKKNTGEWKRGLEEIVSVMAKSGSLCEAAVNRLWGSVTLPSPWQSRGRSTLEYALDPMKEGCLKRTAYELSSLSGLGPGLTPAGDDFLVGVLAFCRYWPEEWCTEFTAALKAALEERGRRTSWLSQALLTCAFDSEFALPIHRVFKAEDQESLIGAAAKVIAWGHTSGSDTLGGIVWMAARAMGGTSRILQNGRRI